MFIRISIYLLLCMPLIVSADVTGGQLTATVDGQSVSFPVLKNDISVDIQGDLSTVTIVQTFINPLSSPVHASYLFPLNKESAVYEMEMEVGSERIKALIKEKQEAKKIFNQAKSEGKSAVLLQQQRPNMFTQDIANLMPHLPIKVTLRYVQTIARVDDQYQLVVPMVVGPRYQPQGAGVAPAHIEDNPEESENMPTDAYNKIAKFGRWELETLPVYPPVFGLDVPDTIDADRVSIQVNLHAGMLINHVSSNTHALTTNKMSDEEWEISLKHRRVIDNQDFVLNYSLAATRSQAGLLAHRDERGGYFSLLVEPPKVPASNDIMAREMVFLLDCSGSMSGLPMNASKAFMREALHNLRSGDSFRIIRFSDQATEFSKHALPANSTNIRAGLKYTDALYGSGGTEMMSGIRQALLPAESPNVMRIVVFLTDGFIGNEATIFEYINRNIGASRIFTFGVGTSVNRYLLAEVARTGRGFARYMDPTEGIEEVSKSLVARLQTPILTDIKIDWQDLDVSDVNPNPIPDLFAGQSLRIMGRYSKPGTYTVNVQGKVNGRGANLPIQVVLPEKSTDGEAIALIWARSKIKHYMEQFPVPHHARVSSNSDDELKQRITKLGLDYSLVTNWTSFVAVTEQIYNSHVEGTPARQVPLPMVKGVSQKAYPPVNINGPSFSGNSAPEPSVYAGMIMLSLLFGFWLYGKRSSKQSVA